MRSKVRSFDGTTIVICITFQMIKKSNVLNDNPWLVTHAAWLRRRRWQFVDNGRNSWNFRSALLVVQRSGRNWVWRVVWLGWRTWVLSRSLCIFRRFFLVVSFYGRDELITWWVCSFVVGSGITRVNIAREKLTSSRGFLAGREWDAAEVGIRSFSPSHPTRRRILPWLQECHSKRGLRLRHWPFVLRVGVEINTVVENRSSFPITKRAWKPVQNQHWFFFLIDYFNEVNNLYTYTFVIDIPSFEWLSFPFPGKY